MLIMEEDGCGNVELESSNLRGGRKNSPLFDLIIGLLIYGWEGPLTVVKGLSEGNNALIVIGLLLTVFLWGLTIIPPFLDLLKPSK